MDDKLPFGALILTSHVKLEICQLFLFTKSFEQKMLQKVELSSLGGKERKIPF